MAALENLDPAVRLEAILDGQDIVPATRIEYFLKKAAEGGGGDSGKYVKVYDSTELLSEPIPVVSDIDGQTMQYTSGRLVIANDFDNSKFGVFLADETTLNSPFAVISSTGEVLLTVLMYNNIDDIKPFAPPANANAEPSFYIKEISANAKCAYVSSNGVDRNGVVDSTYVTLGYGYTRKTD